MDFAMWQHSDSESFGLDDIDLAKRLQEEYDREAAAALLAAETEDDSTISESSNSKQTVLSSTRHLQARRISPVDPSLEVTDPNPDIRELFLQFNDQFFWGYLSGIEVKWSPRMTLCAGLCVYEGHGGLCSVRLSLPLLKLRPRKDLVETLLHEMIHAYLFVTANYRDHDDHGPNFKSHMDRINVDTGANISIYHTFHDEVESYRQHWWKCSGPCQKRPPYYGMVKRAMNRAPSHRDPWFNEHQATCGGTFTKIKEPKDYGLKKTGGKGKSGKSEKSSMDSSGFPAFLGKGVILGSSSLPGKQLNSDNPTGGGRVSTGNGGSRVRGGLAVISNGVLTHTQVSVPLDVGRPPEQGRPLFSTITPASSSTSTSTNRINSQSSSHNASDLLSPPSKSNRPTKDKSGNSSNKSSCNDNMTLLECFKRQQALANKGLSGIKEKGGPSDKDNETGGIKVRQVSKNPCNIDDDFVDLTAPDEIQGVKLSSSSDLKNKNLSTSDKISRADKKAHWRKIFPTLSGKKRDKTKGVNKGRFSGNFVSVCLGGSHDSKRIRQGDKEPRGGYKYVFDELDANVGLWDEDERGDDVDDKSCSEPRGSGQGVKQELLRHGQKPSNPSGYDAERGASVTRPSSSVDQGRSGGATLEHESSLLARDCKKLNGERELEVHQTDLPTGLLAAPKRASEKRSSGAAFGREDSRPKAKRHNGDEADASRGQEDIQDMAVDAQAHGMVPCPACTQFVPQADINDHLDLCLF